MATVAYTLDLPAATGGQTVTEFPEGARVVKWANMANGDVGSPYVAPHRSEKTVQASGTPGAGATPLFIIEGTLTPNTPIWGTVHKPDGTDLKWVNADVTANRLFTVLENVYQIRPNMSGGDGTTNVTVEMLVFTVARR